MVMQIKLIVVVVVVYMAPEILDGTTRLQFATTEDLKRVDIWALGMTLFVLLNPCVKYPYSQELKCFLEKGESALKGLEKLMTHRKIPAEPLKYQHKHAVDWYFIERISKACINFTPKERPTIEEVVAMIGKEPTASSLQIHLKNSQSTSLEEFDREVARVVAKNGEFDAENALSQPDNDGTNACAFFSIKIANEIYRLFQEGRCDDKQFVENVCAETESIIIDLPFAINPYRNIEEFYDVQSAYALLRSIGAVDKYDFYEELLSHDHVFSHEGRKALKEALSSMLSKKELSLAIYTCAPFIFTIGVTNDCMFLIDTHPVPQLCGGKGTGILKLFPYTKDEVNTSDALCCWIWQRLSSSGVKNDTLQSLSRISKVERYFFRLT